MPIAAFERTLFHLLFFSGRRRYIVPIASCLGWVFLIQLSQQAWFPLHYSMLPCHCIRYCYPQSKPSSCFFTYISSFKLVKTIQGDSWQTSCAREALKWCNFGTGRWIRNEIGYDAYDDWNTVMMLFTRNTAYAQSKRWQHCGDTLFSRRRAYWCVRTRRHQQPCNS